MTYKKKLIEVALPLDAINKACAREKSIRHGHPSTLHLWWARRPLAAARAVIFAQMVDDPSTYCDTQEEEDKERKRLFKIIEDLVLWENTTNEEVLNKARKEIWKSWRRTCADNADHPRAEELFNPEKLPAFHDPFAGGGALPLEAQRLGLEAYASDLNPVAVLINKAMIEIPPKFAGREPVNPEWQNKSAADKMGADWSGAKGLAEDVRYYGKWMRDEAEKRIGHLYPKVEITKEMAKERPDLKQYVGEKLTVIAWLWARTVKSPNPAYSHIDVPLASTFMLSTKPGKEAYVEPIIEKDGYRFTVKVGKPKDPKATKAGTKLARGASFSCIMSDAPMGKDYIRGEFQANHANQRLMAIVVEGSRGRIYLSPTEKAEEIAQEASPTWKPELEMNQDCKDLVSGRGYGFKYWHELFTPRQLVALTTFSDLVQEAMEKIKSDATSAGMSDDESGLDDGCTGTRAYSEAVGVYLGCALGKSGDYNSTICSWISGGQTMRNTFGRQAIPMVWDFAEANIISETTGSYQSCINQVVRVLRTLPAKGHGSCNQQDAQHSMFSVHKCVSTDPPYYDNIGYADLSDFFYVWLRRSLKQVFPNLFSTLAVPKAEELVATPYRHGSKKRAEAFFLDGMTGAMKQLAEQTHIGFPVSIYYAFKQSERDNEEGRSSTGWETFLEAVMQAGFSIGGTWPMRTELSNRMIGSGTNALASSIVLVCRKRDISAALTTRKDFISKLKEELPLALKTLQQSHIAPVDLAQASIGPGMAIFSRYSKVVEADGDSMSVRSALALINQVLDEILAEQEGEFDTDTRWAIAWFEQYGMSEGEYGQAETLTTAKNTSVNGLKEAGILYSKSNKVRLLARDELKKDWDPQTDKRLTDWEICQYLISALEQGGNDPAAILLRKIGGKAEVARDLAYRLYSICDKKKWSQEALAYNLLITAWPEIASVASKITAPEPVQQSMEGLT